MLVREHFEGSQRVNKAEVEVKVERRPDFLHLSLNRSLSLPIMPADYFSILLRLNKSDEFLVDQIRSFPLRDVSRSGDSDES